MTIFHSCIGSTGDMSVPRKQMGFRTSKADSYCCSGAGVACWETPEKCKKNCKTICY